MLRKGLLRLLRVEIVAYINLCMQLFVVQLVRISSSTYQIIVIYDLR